MRKRTCDRDQCAKDEHGNNSSDGDDSRRRSAAFHPYPRHRRLGHRRRRSSSSSSHYDEGQRYGGNLAKDLKIWREMKKDLAGKDSFGCLLEGV